jgi:CRP-like cAMP-binding protein
MDNLTTPLAFDPYSQRILFYLQSFKNLTYEDLLPLLQLAKPRHLAASEVYIQQNSTHRKIALILTGLIRVYLVKPNGDEITTELSWEDQIVACQDAIFLNKPSRFTYQAMEETDLLEIDYDALQTLLESTPKLESTRKYFLMNMLAQSMDRIESFVLLSPEERYRQLVEQKPNIINRVPNKYIATFLGITPVSLSRLRRRMASRHER